MIKIIHKNPVSSFNAQWLTPIFDQYFVFEPWDPEKTYAPGTLFYTNRSDYCDISGYHWAADLADQGFRVIVDNLWEVVAGGVPGAHIVSCCRWFWYNESLWYRHEQLHQYLPCRNTQYLALMPMNRSRAHRTEFLQAVQPLLPRMVWSSVEQHQRQLPGDGDMNDWNTQRKMNAEWYDSTYLSMVVESSVRPMSRYTPVFITEKTMKPLAFQHPFVVYGNRGTLRTLHQWGFETFDHLWDESYDEIVDHQQRKDAVVQLLNSIEIQPHSAETQRRLIHNTNHFFDRDLVIQGIKKEIVEPILEYAETKH